MKGSSFGAIYDAFDGFERQMEDALEVSSMRMSLPVSLLLLSAWHSRSSRSLDATTLAFSWITRRGNRDFRLPHEQVEEYGIPYLRSILEKDASKKDIDKWQTFWNYFLRQWMPILWRWNISQKEGPDGSFFDVVNRTNNGLERYNRHFNRLFNKRPSLLEFVQIVEKESRFQDQKLRH